MITPLSIDNVLFVGAGGGYDIFGSLPLTIKLLQIPSYNTFISFTAFSSVGLFSTTPKPDDAALAKEIRFPIGVSKN